MIRTLLMCFAATGLLAGAATTPTTATTATVAEARFEGADGGGPTSDDGLDPTVPELIDAAERDGSVRVLVELAEADDVDALLAEDAELGDLADDVTVYRYHPLLALDADAETLVRLAASGTVVRIHADRAEDPHLMSTIPLIGADVAHDQGLTGAGTTIAVLDTGVDGTHPFFAGRIVAEACYSAPAANRVSMCPNGEAVQVGPGAAEVRIEVCENAGRDICGHGTRVAGIAAGTDDGVSGAPGHGVAPGADIIAIQVFGRYDDPADCPSAAPCPRALWSDVILGMERVLDLTADHDIAALNLSLGGGEYSTACDSDPRKPYVDMLLEAGVITVSSAGNNGWNDRVDMPACISTVVAVGATGPDDRPMSFTNAGPLLDLFAPGATVRTSQPGGGYVDHLVGTSGATPHVAGAFAVLRQARPDDTPQQLRELIRNTGVEITYQSGGTDTTTPRLDLAAALR